MIVRSDILCVPSPLANGGNHNLVTSQKLVLMLLKILLVKELVETTFKTESRVFSLLPASTPIILLV